MKQTKIIACDFDNCLSLHGKYPIPGKPNTKLFEYLKARQSDGDKIVLWTCRCGEDLQVAVDFCRISGLIPDYVNENVPEMIEKYGNDCRKVFAHLYIDDCARTPWEIIEYKPKEKPVVKHRKAKIVR